MDVPFHQQHEFIVFPPLTTTMALLRTIRILIRHQMARSDILRSMWEHSFYFIYSFIFVLHQSTRLPLDLIHVNMCFYSHYPLFRSAEVWVLNIHEWGKKKIFPTQRASMLTLQRSEISPVWDALSNRHSSLAGWTRYERPLNILTDLKYGRWPPRLGFQPIGWYFAAPYHTE